ncbi:DNA-directed RNA polymerase III subunit RPC8-like protein [Cokeromyces recurvatus]|uniref:DNA-directed RNA polymerase III subunit RPC8-like protein n=1 Tax=Cokeromyces recurvatus TaxID=90255 RepID=UPI0022205CF0|nr:DNA-directed RNA polymerase III subunit RPC8-like protein [Cokeromyces recurvatus]KAI7904774.1 DNA-directed RNA polymerase III subunit RPC8-like protein [Cokeromyces recurvatus]
MFILSELEDTVKIIPNDFKKDDNDAITDVLNEKYANKVVQEVGLCICVHDILETSEGFILYGDGCSYIKVTFRVVVFRPFVGEILVGKIKSCSPNGVLVTMGFFDDILIPGGALQPGTKFDPAEQVWVWNYEGEKMYMDIEEPIRFRVLREQFTDITPTVHPPLPPTGRRRSIADTTANDDLAANSTKIPPYSITCTIQEDGLGLLSWWGS